MKPAVLIATCLAIATVLPAQATEDAESRKEDPAQGSIHYRAEPHEEFFDLRFPGGTLESLVRLFEKDLKGDYNFLVTPSAARMQVPPLNLDGVRLDGLMTVLPNFLQHLSQPEGRIHLQVTAQHNFYTIVDRIRRSAPEPTLFDLDFPGGTLAELIRELKKKDREDLNLLAEGEAGAAPVPALKLQGVDLDMVVGILPRLLQKSGGRDRRFLRVNKTPNHNPRIYTFTLERYGRTTPPQTGAFNLSQLLQEKKLKIEDLITAIQTACRMANADEEPVLQYHQETRLLLVKGSSRTLNLVSDLLRQLQLTNAEKEQLARLEEENRKLKQHITELRAKLAEAGKGK